MGGPRSPRVLLASVLTAVALGVAIQSGRSEEFVQRGETNDGGIAVRWTLAASTAGLGHLDVRIADALSGQPYDIRPGGLKGWLQHARRALSDAETPCAAKVVTLRQRPIGGRAGVDLNTARLVTLNTNGSITILNPAGGAGRSRLEAVIDLPDRPTNWVRVPGRMELWVLLEHGRLALVDIAARRVTRVRDLPEGAEGRDLAFDAARRLLWVSLPSRAAVAHLDVASPDAAMVVEPGATPLGLMPAVAEGTPVPPGGGEDPASSAVVVLAEPDTVIWRDGPAVRMAWQIGTRPVVAAYSALSRHLVAAGADGSLTALDPGNPDAPPQRAHLDHPVTQMMLFEGGRRAFAMGGGRASIVDLATMQTTLAVDAPAGAATLLGTNSFLYALDASGDTTTLWSLAGLAAGRDERTTVSLGSLARAPAGEARFGLAMAVSAENGAGVIAAHPGSDLLSAYTEGGMQPVDAYSNVRREPMGLKLFDPSLRQTAPGRYEADLQAARGGSYELVLAAESPSVSVCAPVQWPAMQEDEASAAPHPRAVLVGIEAASDGAQRVRLHVEDRPDGAALAGAPDLTLLVFNRLTAWQTRLPLSETAPGDYETLVKVPEHGRYRLHAFSHVRGLSETAGALGEVPLGVAP